MRWLQLLANTHLRCLQTRAYARTTPGKKQAIFYGTWDVSLSLMVAFFVNAAILITAAGKTASNQSLCVCICCLNSPVFPCAVLMARA